MKSDKPNVIPLQVSPYTDRRCCDIPTTGDVTMWTCAPRRRSISRAAYQCSTERSPSPFCLSVLGRDEQLVSRDATLLVHRPSMSSNAFSNLLVITSGRKCLTYVL